MPSLTREQLEDLDRAADPHGIARLVIAELRRAREALRRITDGNGEGEEVGIEYVNDCCYWDEDQPECKQSVVGIRYREKDGNRFYVTVCASHLGPDGVRFD